jgi:hypothetical protein
VRPNSLATGEEVALETHSLRSVSNNALWRQCTDAIGELMAVINMQFDWMWAQDFDDPHSISRTIQVPNQDAIAEIALYSTWTGGESHHASNAFITQIVSASGVEEFPSENVTGGDLVSVVFRRRVTSVTFKLAVFQTKGMARWMIYHWG